MGSMAYDYQDKYDPNNDNLGDQIERINYCCVANHSISYTYDKVGNILTADVGGNYGWTFGYDNIYQVTDADQASLSPQRNVDFSYDSVYNRTLWTDTLGSVNVGYQHNALHQYTQVGSTTPTYDNNGNITSGYGGGLTLTYDCENRLTTAGSVSYTYDLIGRRNSRTYSTSTTVYVYDGDHIIAEYSSSGSLIRKYIYGPGMDNPAVMINIYLEEGGSPLEARYYYYADAQGSIRLITDKLGNPVESYMYDVYGQPRVMWSAGADGNWLTEDVTTYSSSVIGNRFMFTGREWDWNTSLYYYRARDYSPTLGRFLQTDPIGYADSMNLYAYCGNNPVNWIDPYGEMILLGPQELILPRQLFIPRETVIPWDVAIPAPPITGPIPAPPIAIPMGEKCPPRTKDGGALTEPKMPDSTIGKEGGVEIRHNYKGGDHGPPHFHVKGNGPDNKIGQMGKPLDPTKPLTPAQERLVEKYLPQIRKAADQIMRYHRYQNAPPKSVPLYNKYGQYRGA
jgi:RHS repeat-associated protein